MYYATRTLKIKNSDGEYEFRHIGDAVPEAQTWEKRILDANVDAGHLVLRLAPMAEAPAKKDDILEKETSEVEPVKTKVKRRRGRPRKASKA